MVIRQWIVFLRSYDLLRAPCCSCPAITVDQHLPTTNFKHETLIKATTAWWMNCTELQNHGVKEELPFSTVNSDYLNRDQVHMTPKNNTIQLQLIEMTLMCQPTPNLIYSILTSLDLNIKRHFSLQKYQTAFSFQRMRFIYLLFVFVFCSTECFFFFLSFYDMVIPIICVHVTKSFSNAVERGKKI